MDPRAEWEEVARHPDSREDLDYELTDLEVFESDGGETHLLFLPWNEDMLGEESFIVAGIDAVVDPLDVR